jgi:hypothetical protein
MLEYARTDPFQDRGMRQKSLWNRIITSWWGRSLAGAFVGGLLIAFSGVDDPVWFLLGMLAGALALFFLGRLQ